MVTRKWCFGASQGTFGPVCPQSPQLIFQDFPDADHITARSRGHQRSCCQCYAFLYQFRLGFRPIGKQGVWGALAQI